MLCWCLFGKYFAVWATRCAGIGVGKTYIKQDVTTVVLSGCLSNAWSDAAVIRVSIKFAHATNMPSIQRVD